LGQEIAILFEGIRQSGKYEAIFDGNKLASGLYLYKLKAGDFIKLNKMMLVK
jgi:hypothetical protein